MKNILLLIAFPLLIHCENSTKKQLVIDESDYKEVVEQVIEIDSVSKYLPDYDEKEQIDLLFRFIQGSTYLRLW